jgi:hypothetical protein
VRRPFRITARVGDSMRLGSRKSPVRFGKGPWNETSKGRVPKCRIASLRWSRGPTIERRIHSHSRPGLDVPSKRSELLKTGTPEG